MFVDLPGSSSGYLRGCIAGSIPGGFLHGAAAGEEEEEGHGGQCCKAAIHAFQPNNPNRSSGWDGQPARTNARTHPASVADNVMIDMT
ncbi:hypothetical protein StoSoilA2_02680 [Arthrobacter sp. StoSoilA2]|nr:hypothetical protein StoSoilA2_02680 [Arthrobacter sp. StoSoilA2]